MINLYPHFSKNSTVENYLLDYKEGEFPDKAFFYGILSTRSRRSRLPCKTARSNRALDRDEGNGELVKVSE